MSSPDFLQRAEAAYLGLAVGDALGATVEFMTPREIRAEHGVHCEIRGGGWLKLPPGRVTDDTEMALALGEAIIAGAGEVQADAVAAAFDAWMRSKPVDIGNTVRRGILAWRREGSSAVPLNEYDGGNGACMRVLPVAIATAGHPDAAVRRAVLAQNHVTHHNSLSDAGTLCVVEMLQAAFAGADRLELLHGPVRRLIDAHPEFNFRRRRRDNPSGFIVDTLQAVFQGLFDTNTLEECLVEVVNRGGDADTTGGIAGMLTGACYGLEALPGRWVEAVDGATAERCRMQASALCRFAACER